MGRGRLGGLMLISFLCVRTLYANTDTQALPPDQTPPDLLAISSTSRGQLELGRGVDLAGLTTGLRPCIVHDGVKNRIAEGTGVRAEVFVDLTNGWSAADFFDAIGLAPPALDSPIYDQEIGTYYHMLGRWFARPGFSFAVVLSRDDGVFTYSGLRFDESAVAGDIPSTNVLQWIRQRCGSIVTDRWREQARVIFLYRSTARIRPSDPPGSRLTLMLARGSMGTSAHRSYSDQQTRNGDKELLSLQHDSARGNWPSEDFWAELLRHGPVEFANLVVTDGFVTASNVTTATELSRLPHSFGFSLNLLQTGKTARVTHAGYVPIDQYLPSRFKPTDSNVQTSNEFARGASVLQSDALEAMTRRFHVLSLIEQISGELKGEPHNGRLSPLLPSNVQRILSDTLAELRNYDEEQLRGWHDDRPSALSRAISAESESGKLPPEWYGTYDFNIPTWTASEIRGMSAQDRWPLPPSAATRVGMVWFGKCTGEFQGRLAVSAASFLASSKENKHLILTASYSTGFLLTDHSAGFLEVLGYNTNDLLFNSERKWDGSQYGQAFQKTAPISKRSDVAVLLAYDYPIDSSVKARLTWLDETTNMQGSADLVATQWQVQNHPRQGLFGLLPCVSIDDILLDRITLRFTSGASGYADDVKELQWKVTNSPANASDTEAALPQWFVDELHKTPPPNLPIERPLSPAISQSPR